ADHELYRTEIAAGEDVARGRRRAADEVAGDRDADRGAVAEERRAGRIGIEEVAFDDGIVGRRRRSDVDVRVGRSVEDETSHRRARPDHAQDVIEYTEQAAIHLDLEHRVVADRERV